MHPELEKVKSDFSAEKLASAQARSWEAVHAIAERMEPGMLESEAREIAQQVLKQKGAERFWHRTHVRFGVNTLRTFSDTSLPGVRLQNRDIFFLDIGPVFDGYEGDAGKTFTVGEDPEMRRAAEDTRFLFKLVRDYWAEKNVTGKALYAFATQQATQLGWEFILRGASGHRIGDFPHALYHRGNMESLQIIPAAQRWVLEIQLKHPTRQFGAFHEDILN
jgi:methionyl aminopeptidase